VNKVSVREGQKCIMTHEARVSIKAQNSSSATIVIFGISNSDEKIA
jgi:hypothetical protein